MTTNSLFNKIENSFNNATKGTEDFNIVIWYWGVIAYIFALLVENYLMGFSRLFVIKAVLSVLFIIYFSWHIYTIHKCKPKKEKLTKEQKMILKQKEKQERFKVLAQKILLQRPMTEWNAPLVLTVIDLYLISKFMSELL